MKKLLLILFMKLYRFIRKLYKIRLVTKYGARAWESELSEAIRREECMCYSCLFFKKGNPKINCRKAQTLYEFCVSENIAAPVMRCPMYIKPLQLK